MGALRVARSHAEGPEIKSDRCARAMPSHRPARLLVMRVQSDRLCTRHRLATALRLFVIACALAAQAGDPAVGKTALVQMFNSSGAKFPKTYQMTCGAEFCSKQVPIPDSDVSVELHLFDTGGQDLFTEMLPSLWKVRPAPRGLRPLMCRAAGGGRARCAGLTRCANPNPNTPGWRGDRAGVRPGAAVHLRGVPQLDAADTRGAATAAQHGQNASSGRRSAA